MVEKRKVTQVIFKAIDEINRQLPKERQLEKSTEIVLNGKTGSLDSLGLVNLVVLTEEMLEDEFGVMVNIADQKAMAQVNNPFRTVGTLTDYIATLLLEARNGH